MKRSTEAPVARTATRSAGFTLLEVLAAVAVLGLWFTVLASVGIQGLRAEGTNERRIRASLLADGLLADLEVQIADGELPEEESESEDDEFAIRIVRTPIPDATLEEGETALLALLDSELGDFAASLYQLRIDVTWTEGVDEQHVSRTTYAWDDTGFRQALAANPGLADPDAAAAGGPGGSSRSSSGRGSSNQDYDAGGRE